MIKKKEEMTVAVLMQDNGLIYQLLESIRGEEVDINDLQEDILALIRENTTTEGGRVIKILGGGLSANKEY